MKLSPSSLLVLLVYLRIERCIGFILIRTPHSRYKNTIAVGVSASLSHRQKQKQRSIFSSSNNRQHQHVDNLVVLNGYAQVNDYFSSFNNNNNNDENENDEDSSEEISSGHDHDIRQVEDDDEPTRRRRRSMTYEEIVAYNNARLCPKLLLTQCAIQSFIHLLEECRDPHSGKVST